jgi:hypothetical protein
VDVAFVEEFASYGFAYLAFEEYVVWDDYGAFPFILRRVLTCCRKFSCLLLVVAQKSWRSNVSASLSALPALPDTQSSLGPN